MDSLRLGRGSAFDRRARAGGEVRTAFGNCRACFFAEVRSRYYVFDKSVRHSKHFTKLIRSTLFQPKQCGYSTNGVLTQCVIS